MLDPMGSSSFPSSMSEVSKREWTAVPVVLVSVLEVVHVAADVLVHWVAVLSLLGNAEVNKVTGVLHDKLALLERSRCNDPTTFTLNLHHLQVSIHRFTTLQTMWNPRHFSDSSRHSSVALSMLRVTQIPTLLVRNTCTDANMQLTINSFRQVFPD